MPGIPEHTWLWGGMIPGRERGVTGVCGRGPALRRDSRKDLSSRDQEKKKGQMWKDGNACEKSLHFLSKSRVDAIGCVSGRVQCVGNGGAGRSCEIVAGEAQCLYQMENPLRAKCEELEACSWSVLKPWSPQARGGTFSNHVALAAQHQQRGM